MTKRAVLVVLIVVLILLGLGLWLMTAAGLGISAGRVLVADNGSVLLIHENSPIVLHSRCGAWMLEGLSTGDEVLVFHDGVEESYPGRTGAYFVFRKGGGSIDDIPAQVLDTLRELGWIR